MDGSAFDIVVTDVLMPGRDGTALLEEIRETHPAVIRAVLTGKGDPAPPGRLLALAHNVVQKPASSRELGGLLTRAERIRALLPEPSVRAVVGRLKSLPHAPRVYSNLMKATESGGKSASDIAQIVAQDPAITAKVLQLANSSFFRTGKAIATVEEAVIQLGLVVLRNLVLSVEVFSQTPKLPPSSGLSIEGLRRHALAVGRLASRMSPTPALSPLAFLTGVLHDIGLLILGSTEPLLLARSLRAVRAEGRPLPMAQRDVMGIAHHQAGAYLLGLWGLPQEVMEAIAAFDEPWPAPRTMEPELDLTVILHLSSALIDECRPVSDLLEPGVGVLDDELLAALAIEHRLPTWRQWAAEEATRPTDFG